MEYEYRTAKSNVSACIRDQHRKSSSYLFIAPNHGPPKQKGNQNAQSNNLPVINFLKKTISLDIPANTVIFIDTHACATPDVAIWGWQGCAAGCRCEPGECIFLFFFGCLHSLSSWQLINGFIGQPFLECMAAASKLGSMLLANQPCNTRDIPE